MNMKSGKIRNASGWTKFRLLTWKNFLQQWRHPWQTAIELLLPVLTMTLVLILRWQIEPYLNEVIIFEPFSATSLSESSIILTRMNYTELSIAYSPESEVLDDVVRTAVANLFAINAASVYEILAPSNFTIPPWIQLPDIDLPPDIEFPPDIDFFNMTFPGDIPVVIEFFKNLITVNGYASSADLYEIYSDEEITRNVIAAVEFDDALKGATELPENISYALRFPERPRFNAFFGYGGSRSWRTDLLFPVFELAGPRSFNSNGGRDPGYYLEMFIALQHMISSTLISKLTGDPLNSFDVILQRYPHPEYVVDYVVELLQLMFPMFIMLSYSYAAVNITRAVTVEKELQLKETLKIMGVPVWTHWTAWFCKQFLYLMVGSALIIVILKVNWFSNEEGFSEYAVFTNTPWTVLFFFLLLYLACTIFFSFMLSGFFTKGSTAALFAGVIWFLTYIPAFLLAMDVSVSIPVQVISCFCINSAMSFGFMLITGKESTGGMQWGDFMSAPSTNSPRLLFGHIIIMLVVDCIVYMLIALYLEQVYPGAYGTPKPWYFLFQKQTYFPAKRKIVPVDTNEDIQSSPEVIREVDPTGHNVGVKMRNLSKVFGNHVAVNNLQLDIYDDQITVLLGHNGAGKSTTISMLTGNVEVSSGSVSVAGYDMAQQASAARSHIGLCHQHNVLFNDLTVKEHLNFFSSLKGYTGKELENDVEILIEKLELQEKRDYPAKGLSGGQKRRLCVGIALCGDARVVLLDEPTSGMDPSSRRALWDLLEKEKLGRSMILTTHFMDEADILGDRIAIMASGKLKCVGSPYFLKRHYGVGYTLVIVKDTGFDLNACTNLIRGHIVDAIIKDDRGMEVTYNLNNEHSHIFEKMLSSLESERSEIKYKNYGLIATTLEDVFMSVGTDLGTSISDDEMGVGSNSGETEVYDLTSLDQLTDSELHVGWRLVWHHVLAMWLKLWLVWTRSWGILMLQVLVPVLQINISLWISSYISRLLPELERRALSLAEGFTSTESILSFNGTLSTSIGALATSAYEMMIQAANPDSNMGITVVDEPVDQYYLKITENPLDMAANRHRVLTGATFNDDSSTVWFSNFGYHDIAISLASVHSALLKARIPTAEINVFNHPLPVNYADQSDILTWMQLVTMQLSASIGSSMGVCTAVFVMFYIKERISRAKLLQKSSGIQPVVMWGSTAIFDWCWFLILSVIVIISCAAFQVLGLSSTTELGRLYLCLVIFGAAMIPINYLWTLVFQGPALGFVVVFFVNFLLGMLCPQLVEIMAQPGLKTTEFALVMDYILPIYPTYGLVSAISLMHRHSMTVAHCMNSCERFSNVLNVSCTLSNMCGVMPDVCCVPEDPYFDWEEPGILRYLIMMIVACIASWALFLTIEYNLFQKVFRRRRAPPPLDESTVDADVADEAVHAERSMADCGLVTRRLTKYYGKHLAVNQVSFSVNESECFGLLGVNGAGKTTTFKMLMGDESVSSGEALVGGYSVTKQITKVHKNIGYCPQFDALFGELTGRQTLRLFAMLRGLNNTAIKTRSAALAQSLGFTEHLDKRVNQYSGGTKRKLSTAVSLLGKTKLVFVDEPTTGVDPGAKRQVWRAIRAAQRDGRGVLLTSHSMEECEALCSRLAIMVNGRFQCLGTPQHLKNKFSQGFTLTIKLKTAARVNSISSNSSIANPSEEVKQYVQANFVEPKLMEEHRGLLAFYLPDQSVAWSKMFGIMERAKSELFVEDYNISQTTLEQIFLQFTKYQQ